jgi:alkylation response protein AidB-like acyl-CoA dehydrogenase
VPRNLTALMHELGPEFAARAARCDEDLFVAENYEMENDLATARPAQHDMLDAAGTAEPSEQTTNRIMTDRTILAQSAIRAVAKAMEVAGGAALYRDLGLERRFRDVQAARFHPLQEKAQLRYAGRVALGLDVND